jgi:hypothetical protein
VRGDATAAYLSELGLKKFVRHFVYVSQNSFTITDEVETTNPSMLALLLHADAKIEKLDENRFDIVAGDVQLLVEPSIDFPARTQFKTAIETNVVTAPGPPGAVDKGEQQPRGRRLVLSTPVPVTRARFIQRLTISSK